MKFEKPNSEGEPSDKQREITKKPKKELVLMQSTRPMSIKEMREVAEAEGLQPATLEDLLELMNSTDRDRIPARQEDVVTEGHEVTDKGKRLSPKKE